ncbi:MAG: hypothetical protein IKZ53_06805 [Selenomonadaceae bacterium]|nr:hypothetical protein [Selenomonadaceae bacterium]
MKVRGLGEENYFDEISVSKAANNHGVCKFKQRIAEENFSIYQNAIGKSVSVELDSGRPIFFGEVTEIFIEQTFHGSYVEVEAKSSSLKIDAAPQTRIFQNPEKFFREILNPERLCLKNFSIELEDKLAAKPCREIILQNVETDFEFIKRLSAWQGRRVWVKDTLQGKCELKIAQCSDDSANKISQDDVISLKLGRRGEIRTAEIITQKYFEIGRILKLGKDPCKFLIVALEVYLENGVERMRFELEELQEPTPSDLLTPPAKLLAKVTDISDEKNMGRLKVQFEIEDKDLKKIWLPYRTPYSGIIFLPEIGETVEIFYLNGDGYAVSTLRTKILDDEFRNVKDKYLGNNRRQRIFFREKSLEIKSSETSIFMDDKKIILSVGENKIVMDEQGISLKTGGKFDVSAGGTAKIKSNGIDIDSGGAAKIKGNSIDIDSGGAAKIKGSSIDIDSSGTAKIKGSSVELR